MQDAVFIAAPPGTAWPLSREDAERHLLARYPDLQSWYKHAPVSDTDYLDFEVELDGTARHGSYFERSHLIRRDGGPAFRADTVAWFRQLLPAGTPVVVMTESNPDVVLTLLLDASPQEIGELLQALLGVE
ncbi:hypothetical protein EH183_40320 [Streptomyces sp. CB01881]|uniref:hypothetical protein n=1 Tax=Streptomyces sp. CB01881 TaxID=2078691 RepID=UPI0011DFB8F2|nr:hypothetical protein [Streptomyces sp. CB01881]TYC68125.1 hypothetical protein EH183_40320 [Streptomyces sp. CB01881]